MKRNNFRGYFTQEDHLTNAVVNYVVLQYPSAVVFHIPNEGKRTAFEQSKAKYLGIRSGVSDLWIFYKGKQVVIELKVKYGNGKKNYLSSNQKKFIEDMKGNGFPVHVCYDFDEAKEIIDEEINEHS